MKIEMLRCNLCQRDFDLDRLHIDIACIGSCGYERTYELHGGSESDWHICKDCCIGISFSYKKVFKE